MTPERLKQIRAVIDSGDHYDPRWTANVVRQLIEAIEEANRHRDALKQANDKLRKRLEELL